MKLKAAGHLTEVFDKSESVLRKASKTLKGKGIEVLVVTGISGIALGARLAARLKIKLAIVRRQTDRGSPGGCHSSNDVEGWLGGRWVFFDDLIASGNTRRRTKSEYAAACRVAGQRNEYVGSYLYRDGWMEPEVDYAGDPDRPKGCA